MKTLWGGRCPARPSNTAVGSGKGLLVLTTFSKTLGACWDSVLLYFRIWRESSTFRLQTRHSFLWGSEMHLWRLSAFLTPKETSVSTLTSLPPSVKSSEPPGGWLGQAMCHIHKMLNREILDLFLAFFFLFKTGFPAREKISGLVSSACLAGQEEPEKVRTQFCWVLWYEKCSSSLVSKVLQQLNHRRQEKEH